MSEVEDKTGYVTALVYTKETVQDELYSSYSVHLPTSKQTRSELSSVGQELLFLPTWKCPSELPLDNVVNVCTQRRV